MAGPRAELHLPVMKRRHSARWVTTLLVWTVILGAVGVGIVMFPRIKERLSLDSAVITPSADGVQVDDGDITFRLPSRPRTVLVHLAEASSGSTGFRLTTTAGTVEVDVKATVRPRTDVEQQQFCAAQIDGISAKLGTPASTDKATDGYGTYTRVVTWHTATEYWFATCKGHRHNSAIVFGHAPTPRLRAYELASETLSFND